MKIAHILPTPYLQYNKQTYHLLLAPQLISDRAYLGYYQTRHERGEFIIVDNGEVEYAYSNELKERLKWEDILAAALAVGADEVCLPDSFTDASETVDMIEHAMALVPPRMRMLIPQGDNAAEWKECCEYLMENVPCRSIGIPKHCERFVGGRAELLLWIENRAFHDDVDVHLLGVWDNAQQEIIVCHQFPWVRGIDTGVAMAYAQHELRLQTYAGKHISMDWDPKRRCNDRLLEHNMSILEDWVNARYTDTSIPSGDSRRGGIDLGVQESLRESESRGGDSPE